MHAEKKSRALVVGKKRGQFRWTTDSHEMKKTRGVLWRERTRKVFHASTKGWNPMPHLICKSFKQEKPAPSVSNPWQKLADSFGRPAKAPFPLMALDEALSELPEPPRDLDEARAAMTQVLRLCPDLGLGGFGGGPDYREAMFERETLIMFQKSRELLRERRKRPGERGIAEGSYHLKHVAGNQIGYVRSGPFIAAALCENCRFAARAEGRLTAQLPFRARPLPEPMKRLAAGINLTRRRAAAIPADANSRGLLC
jgi:hypothetical protein